MQNPTETRRNIEWLEKEIAQLHDKRRENYRNYYQAKGQLKQLKAQTDAER